MPVAWVMVSANFTGSVVFSTTTGPVTSPEASLVGNRIGGHAGQRADSLTHLATVLGIAHVAREIDDDAPAVRVGHVQALDLGSSRRDYVNNGRDGSRLLVHLDTV